MKKFYVLLAVAAMLASCAETDLVNPIPESEPEAIGFETFAQKATKAENSTATYTENDLSNHHSDFSVWASKNVNGTISAVYTNGLVKCIGDPKTWTPTVTKYWDKAASNYYFYAAAPATDVSWDYKQVTGGSDGYLQLANYTLTGTNIATGSNTDLTNNWKGSSGDKDLMIAAKCIVENTNYNKTDPDAVNLDFIHILSKLNIAVKTTIEDVELVKLDVCRLNNKASFNENADINGDSNFNDADKTALQAGSTKRWGTATLDEPYTLVAAGTLPLALTEGAVAVYTHEYLIMPQLVTRQNDCMGLATAPANDAYIYIEYTVNGEPFKAYYGLAQAFAVEHGNNLEFNEGWQNTLTITIQPNAIKFTGDVAVWADRIGGGSI